MTKKVRLLFSLLTVCFFGPLAAQNFHVYISDAGNFDNPPWQILKYDDDGTNGEVFISDHLDWPQDILFLEDKNEMLVSNLNTGVISRFNADNGTFLGEFATGLGGPTRMKMGPDSLLYVLQWQGTGKVRRYTREGVFVDNFTAIGVQTSIGLDWDAGGNLYVSSYNGRYVRKFSPAGADLGNFISSNLAGPTNIWFADNGDLLVMDYNGGAVKRFDSQGNYLGVFISGLPQGEGVDFFPNGNLIIGSGGASAVRIYSPEGVFISNLAPAGSLGLLTPNAVVLRPVVPSVTREAYREVAFVTPSVGALFRLSNPEAFPGLTAFEVYNAVGAFVQKVNFADSAEWNATHLPAGVYYLTAKLHNGALARQPVVVQH